MVDDIECSVCLEQIKCDNNDDSIIFECCTNRVHIKCLKEWSKSNQNINKRSCIICQTETDFLYDFYRNLNLSSHTIIDVSPIQTGDTISNTSYFDSQPIIVTPYVLYSQAIITVICFAGIICLCIAYLALA